MLPWSICTLLCTIIVRILRFINSFILMVCLSGAAADGRQVSLGIKKLSDIMESLWQGEVGREELAGLREVLSVAQVVVSSLDLNDVLQDILCSALGIMDMPAGSIALYEEESRRLTLHAHVGLSETFVSRESWDVKEGGLTQRILNEGELFVVEDVTGEVVFSNPLAQKEGIRALIAMPLKIQDKIVGILYLNDFKPRTFTPLRLHMLSILGSFATMSVDNARLHARTRHLACTDGLTGLYNHRYFLLKFREEMARAVRYEKPLSLVMFDVDDFKKFNDTYGHPAGDKVLMAVARVLQEMVRHNDLAFRYGGEEFMAIFVESSLEQAVTAAERIRAAVAIETTRTLAGIAPVGVTVSVGVATWPRDGEGDALLKVVDDQLYRAKREGKNRVYYRPETENGAAEVLQASADDRLNQPLSAEI